MRRHAHEFERGAARLHRYDEALAQANGAIGVIEKAVGANHPDLAEALLGFGQVQLERGAARDSLAPLERALKIRALEPGDGIELADIRFHLAQALFATGTRERAQQLVTQAIETYRNGNAATREKLAEANAWVAKHH